MDPLTHFLTGAVLGRSGFNRKTAYATLAMTLAAEAPDLDIFWGFRGPVAAFEHHRGITHTFLGMPFIALAATGVVWIIHRIRKKPTTVPIRWGLLWLFSLFAALSHLLLDFTNNYGLRPFFPFNSRWYSGDIVYIVEPLMLIALILALVMPWVFSLADSEIGAKRTKFHGRGWAIAALIFIALLYSIRASEHTQALNLARNSNITREHILRIAAQPHPINPFLWYVIVETPNYFRTASVDSHSGQIDTDAGEMIYKPPVTMATLVAKRSWLGRVYLDWSKFPIVEDKSAMPLPGYDVDPPQKDWHTIQFRDLRFGYPVLSLKSNDNVLSGWVYIGPQEEIEGMFMSGAEQKDNQ